MALSNTKKQIVTQILQITLSTKYNTKITESEVGTSFSSNQYYTDEQMAHMDANDDNYYNSKGEVVGNLHDGLDEIGKLK